MAAPSGLPHLELPKSWPRQVKSAVLHAISLAHFSLTYTRSWAANSWNARIRLKQENDRLQQELALLREEMRIKDSRMLRIPARAGHTIHRPSGWPSSSCGRHMAGPEPRRPGVSSSRPPRSVPGWADWTRRAPEPSSKFEIPSTSSPTSSPTSSADSRSSAPPWAKPRSRRSSVAPACISDRRRSPR